MFIKAKPLTQPCQDTLRSNDKKEDKIILCGNSGVKVKLSIFLFSYLKCLPFAILRSLAALLESPRKN